MPLRLSTTQLEPDQAPEEPEHGAEVVVGFVERALNHLTSERIPEYLALFGEASALDGMHVRYHARRALLEQAMVVTPTVNDRRATAIFLAMAGAAIDVLEEQPAEPVLLNYAGIAFYELWSLDAARDLFKAALRLDPNLPRVANNLKALSVRNRARPPRSAVLHPALKRLSRRATAVARRARPAEGLTLSLCMIVRDEEEMLPRCLEAVAPAVDEIVIVDTGSHDRTIEIARAYDARVIEREWTGSFSEARNTSFDAATGDWIIYLDADEVLVKDDVEKLRALTGQTWREAFYLVETNFTGSEEVGVAVQHSALRVFRNRPEYRFQGRLHEQIAYALPGHLPERMGETLIRLDHYGYLGVVREAKDKANRNLSLLLAQQREGPPTSFLHYNIGSEYAALGDVEKALVEFEESWRLAEATPDGIRLEFLPALANRTVAALRRLNRHEEAISRAEFFLEKFPGFTDLVYYQGYAAFALERYEQAVEYMERAISMGDAPSRYTALVGAGTYMPRIALTMFHLHRRRNAEALEMIEWCVDHHPEFFGVMEPYAIALLRNGRSGAETAAEVERRLSPLTKTHRFMLGTALFEAGAAADAELQFREVLAAQPHSAPTRAALVETLLYQRRYAAAADEAAQLSQDSPLAAAVLRSELFARLLAADHDGAAQGLARAERIGLPAADQALFRAWLALPSGAPAEELPSAATELLELMLESLLRVQDFENFELLVGLYQRVQLPERERRERLAQMYLRRGFLKSAAREWLTVCEQTPDVHALAGLAHVALASGQPENAHTFATQALAMEPENEVLRALVQRTSVAAGA